MDSAEVGALRGLDIRDSYRSNDPDNNIVRDFYIPALRVSQRYDRAVGYFSSSGLIQFSEGLKAFADGGGRMRLIASPHITESDHQQIESGYEVRQVLLTRSLSVLDEMAESHSPVLSFLGELIAHGLLDIKLALVQNGSGFGIYHEKVGVFVDGQQSAIAFTGSANETSGGLSANFESIEVFKSWTADGSRVARIQSNFEELWRGRSPGLTVYEVSEIREIIVEHYVATMSAPTAHQAGNEVHPVVAAGSLQFPNGFIARDYQKLAINSWLKNRFRGIFAMATGTGKTKTALAAATQLSNALVRDRGVLVPVVIVVPYQHLVDQWSKDVREFGVTPIKVMDSKEKWHAEATERLASSKLQGTGQVVFVCTSASFGLAPFQEILSELGAETLIIVDEAHHQGSRSGQSALNPLTRYRLALSATPERHHDGEGTAFLQEYFGPVVFEYSMKQAIDSGALCRYDYFPRLVELSEDELVVYQELSRRIGAALARGGSLEDAEDSVVGKLLRDRANVLGHASGKIPAFLKDLNDHRLESHQLVYCAEGRALVNPTVETQLTMLTKLLGAGLGLKVHSYFSDTDRQVRQELLQRFAAAENLSVLTSMRCLDEGVDVPEARIGYILASSSNPRQFIQRRGRLLRPSPAKTSAVIYDYLVVPPELPPGGGDRIESQLAKRELSRALEFSNLARNKGHALEVLRPIKERFNLYSL